jgi:hypothetical protein
MNTEELLTKFQEKNLVTFEKLITLPIGTNLISIKHGYAMSCTYGGLSPISDNYAHLISVDNIENVIVVYSKSPSQIYLSNSYLDELLIERLIMEGKLKTLTFDLKNLNAEIDANLEYNQQTNKEEE